MENKEKKEKEERKSKEKGKKKKNSAWEKKKELHFPSRFLANRRSKLVGVRGKAGLRDTGYMWVPISKIFIEVLKGRGFLLYRFFFI